MCCFYRLLGSADASLHDQCPWLMSMRDVMVNLEGLHAGVVRDVTTDCDMVQEVQNLLIRINNFRGTFLIFLALVFHPCVSPPHHDYAHANRSLLINLGTGLRTPSATYLNHGYEDAFFDALHPLRLLLDPQSHARCSFQCPRCYPTFCCVL